MLILVKVLSRLMAALPLGLALATGRAFGWFVGCVLRIRREVVVEALTRCFPEKSGKDINRIATQVYKNQGMNIIEMLRISIIGLDDVEGRITIEGMDHVKEISAQDHGSLFLMAHVGNWEITGYSTRVSDRGATAVVKPIKNEALHEYLAQTRKKMNLTMLPHRGSFRECLKALRENNHLTIILDQNRSRDDGVFVDFFGQTACTSMGLAVISYQTKQPVYPLFAIRKNNREHTLIIQPPIEAPTERTVEVLTEFTQRYTKSIEDVIREYPEQWLWLHKRWKTRPLEAAIEKQE